MISSISDCHYNRRDAVCDNTLTPPKKVLQLIPEESIEPENCPASKSEPCDKRRMGKSFFFFFFFFFFLIRILFI